MPKVLLIRNYAPDRQESMLRFADMLMRGLPEEGWEPVVAEPPIRLGSGQNTLSGKGKWLGYADKYLIARSTFRRFVRQSKADIVHICDHSNAMYLPLFQGVTRLITCHDLLAVRSWLGEIPGQSKSFTGGLQQRWILQNLKCAPWVACDSLATHDDLTRLAPGTESRSNVIPVGLNYPYRPLVRDEALKRMRVESALVPFLLDEDEPRPFLFHVGGNTWYKNRPGVLAIFRELLRLNPELPHRLIMAGPETPPELREAAADLGERVCFLDNPDTPLIEALYSIASCFVFPSFAEGFGWPPIEAQACGCPVAVTHVEPVKGNCGDAAVSFDPEQPAKAALAIMPLLTDPVLADAARRASLANAERFTARAMVMAYTALYQKLIDEDSASG